MGYREAIKNAREEDRILSFSRREQEAYKMVQVFLVAVGMCCDKVGCQGDWQLEEFHRLFKSFCQKLGLRGRYYSTKGKFSPAVVLYLGYEELEPGFYFMFTPWVHDRYEWRVDDHPDRKRILEAATEVCREWLPDWKWTVPE